VTEHADALIIGAGASGGVAGRRLAEAGLRVVALEQGTWHSAEDFRGDRPDWELTGLKQWSAIPNVRRNWEDYALDLSESDLGVMNFNGVGGGTILYNAIWVRLQPSAFRSRTLHGFGDDWPLDYRELAPFYDRTDVQFGASGLGGNPAYPDGLEPPLPPLPLGPGGEAVARALARRGWHWWPETNAILSAAYDGRRPCVQRGTCGQGCNEGAKATVDRTHWQRVVELGGEVVTGARVSRIVLDERGLAGGVEWVDRDGHGHFQSADVVLVAANGVGTPRLLLQSAEPRFPDGLANRSGLVGRNLMMHPLAVVTGYFEQDMRSWHGHVGSAIQCMEFLESDAGRGFVGGAKWALHPVGGPMLEAFQHVVMGGWGGGVHDAVGMRFGHGARWTVLCEDLPAPDNRVELSPTKHDSSGLPAPKIIYRLGDDVRANLEFNVTRAEDVLREAGAHHVDVDSPSGFQAHLMGTARMGTDPATSVVDPWCMSHDVPNLGVIDGSVFVTGGAVNPTSTIAALALRAAEHLLDHRSTVSVPARRSLHAVPDAMPAALLDPDRDPLLDGSQLLDPDRDPSPDGSQLLDESCRVRLAALADVLIPAAGEMPSASEIGIHEAVLDAVLTSRPDLGEPLARVLGSDFTEPADRMAELGVSDRRGYFAIVEAVCGGYYMHPAVRDLIGYPGQEATVVRQDYWYVDEGLLDHLIDGAWSPGGVRS
jgi:choline dehydrogenase-like flavoprotein